VNEKRKDTKEGTRLGSYVKSSVAGEVYRAFLPPPLPPIPPLDLIPLQKLLVRAGEAIGRIEGTQSSLSDLLLYESNEAPSVSSEGDDRPYRKSRAE
jgi:hypothetical protein